MLEVLLVSWRTTHTTSKCLLQVHRGLRDSLCLSSPSRWGLLSMCLLCLFVAGNNNHDDDDDFRLSWWHFKRISFPLSRFWFSCLWCVTSRDLQQQKKKDKKVMFSVLTRCSTLCLYVEVLRSMFVIWLREGSRWWALFPDVDQLRRTRRDVTGWRGGGGLLHS